MSTTDPRNDVDPSPDVVALVDADITRAVEATAARTASPYFGSADLAVNLRGLRRHVGRLAAHRPDLLGDLAGHYEVPRTAFHVLAAVESDAHDRLHHRYEASGASSTPSVLDARAPRPEAARRKHPHTEPPPTTGQPRPGPGNDPMTTPNPTTTPGVL